MGLRSTYLHNFQLQQKQYCGDWMLLSLRYEDHLYAKLFHHLVLLHYYDQVICYVRWQHGFEIMFILITIRGLGIGKKHEPEECGNGDGRREGLFVLICRQEWRNEAKEREPKPPSNIHKKRLLNSSSLIVIITHKTRSTIRKKYLQLCIMPTAKLSLKVVLVTTQILLFKFFLY